MSQNSLLLEQCESIIEEGLKSLYKVEKAFEIIEQMHLYDEKYNDFKNYCMQKWEIKNKLTKLCQTQNKH
jgi:hypothetical protein